MLRVIYIMYVLIGKEKCNQCNIFKNLLDEKGIQYHYVDVSKIPPELLTYLRMYCNTYPIVLEEWARPRRRESRRRTMYV